MSKPDKYIILNGSIIAEDEAKIPAVSSGLYYGAGCFETFIAENGGIFKFKAHIERLNRGLKYLGVSGKDWVDEDLILKQVKELLEKNGLSNNRSRIRVQVSLNEKGGYLKRDESSLITVISSQIAEKKSDPKKLILSETIVVPSQARPSELKLSNTLHYRQAFREANKKGADDAVMLTVKGSVAETSIANIFWMKDGKVFTPSVHCDILPGIMRNSIIEILNDQLQIDAEEGQFNMDDLLNADFVWLTNSVLEVIPVSDIENISFRVEADFFTLLEKELERYKKENTTYV
ncbi:MAG: aminotransferase class IV [Balneolaceae bacterium]|nr:aminotransferase class IV [Balneolaceae bacterium]